MVQDLRGKAVGSHGVYITRLRQRYGIVATELPFASGASAASILTNPSRESSWLRGRLMVVM